MADNGSITDGRIVLGDSLVISVVRDWHERLADIFEHTSEIVIDGSGVQQIDGVGLQLLVALVKEAESKGLDVKWDGVSDVLFNNAVQLGLDEKLQFDMLMSLD